MDEIERTGGCLCGAVRYRVTGEPLRTGLCHCLDCRKASGSAFSAYAIWPANRCQIEGQLQTYADRSFCPSCGARIGWFADSEAEISLGSMDEAPTDLTPQYELWIGRREHWLEPVSGARQHTGNRP